MPTPITVTVNFIDLTGNTVLGYMQAAVASPSGVYDLYVAGTGIIAPKLTTSTIGSTVSVSIWGNDVIVDTADGLSDTYYTVTLYNTSNIPVWTADYLFTGAGPINLVGYPTLTTVPAPVGSVPTNILVGNNIFTGTNTFTQTVIVQAPLLAKRLSLNTGTALTAGNFVLSSEWGSTATVSAVKGYDPCWEILVTAGGTGILGSPTITLTYADGTWTNSPIAISKMVGGTGSISDISDISTATSMVLTYNGLPSSGSTYLIRGLVIGR